MNNRIKLGQICCLIILVILLNSCKKDSSENLSDIKFGTSKYFKPFLWVKKDLDTITKQFEVEFNQAALNTPEASIELEFVVKEGSSIFKSINHLEVYVNNIRQESNRFKLKASDFVNNRVVKIGIKFFHTSKDKRYKGYLSIVSTQNIDRVNESLTGNNNEAIPIFRWEAQFNRVMNPLLKSLLIVLILIMIILGLWFLILRYILFPRFKGGQLIIKARDNDEEKVNLAGKIGCIFGRYKQPSKLFRIFCGNYVYGLKSEIFFLKIQPVPFKEHRDKHHKRKHLAKLVDQKNIVSLKKLYPEEIPIFGKEILYNNFRYQINDLINFEYLFNKHEKF